MVESSSCFWGFIKVQPRTHPHGDMSDGKSATYSPPTSVRLFWKNQITYFLMQKSASMLVFDCEATVFTQPHATLSASSRQPHKIRHISHFTASDEAMTSDLHKSLLSLITFQRTEIHGLSVVSADWSNICLQWQLCLLHPTNMVTAQCDAPVFPGGNMCCCSLHFHF